MPERSKRSNRVTVAVLLVGTLCGCDPRGASEGAAAVPRPTQGAVGAAVARVQQQIVGAIDRREQGPAPDSAAGSARIPGVTVRGQGLAATADVQADEHHQGALAARTPDGWAVTWTDRDHARAMFARLDGEGRALGAPRVLRESRSGEEDVWAPSVAHNGQHFGVAWTDPANGRVRFARIDAEGRALGDATIVHDGLEMPLSSRVAWNGAEYGVAVAMAEGVYFARVNPQGERVGDGVLVAEGTAVGGLDGLSATGAGYTLTWRDAGEGAARHQARISRDGQVLAVRRVHGDGARVASR